MSDIELTPGHRREYAVIKVVINSLDAPQTRRLCIVVQDGDTCRVIGVERVDGVMRLSYRRVVQSGLITLDCSD